MKRRTLFTAAALAAAAANAENTPLAANPATAKNQIVVSATRIETPIEQVGSSISVISAEDIARRNAQNLQEAIMLLPGVQISANGGPGTASSVFIRGAESDHTLVLINGVRVNSNTSGDFDFSSLPVDMVERIEVLRGPQSGLYGSDALGGVISITTKKGVATPLTGSAVVSVGELGYVNGRANLQGGNEVADFYASLSFFGLDDHDIAKNNGGTEDDPYERTSVYGGVGLNFAEDGRADLTLLYMEDDSDLDGFGGADDPLENSRKKKLFAAISASKPITDTYSQKVSAGYNKQEYTGYNAGPVDFTTEDYDASLQADVTPFENDTLSAGYDFRRSEAENEGNFDKQSRDQHAAFLNNQWAWQESLFITIGGRYDDFSDIDGKATWKSSASWFALEDTRLHGSVGTGYRAPTMNDIYFTFGEPARTYLEPEQSQSFDIGVEQALLDGKLIGDVTYFQSDVEDLIAWEQVSPGVWQPDNVNEAEIQGVEVSLACSPLDTLLVRLFYTYTDAEDVDTGLELPRRALHSGGASLNWRYTEKGNIYSDVVYSGNRYDDVENSVKLEDYVVVGLGTSFALNPTARLVGHISNLFDENYETATGYGTVGRVASAGIEFSF
ncbi:MAG: TonB-dependent receptor [Kiritimatiellae bacterium]|nr:TonB-dependent receptor [Kiritimatiellia bacterium]